MASLDKITKTYKRSRITNEGKACSLHHNNHRAKNLASNFLVQNGNSVRMIPVYLLYKKQKILIRAPIGLQFSQLKVLLYREIYQYEMNQTSSVEVAGKMLKKVLGFSAANGNLKIDYMMSVNQGSLRQSLILQCFFANKKNNRILNYQIYNCLAIGGFSKVYLARSRENGKFYAIKFMKKQSNQTFNADSIQNQMKICSQLEHPFLIEMREGFQTDNFFCLVFQYCPGGQLFYLLKRLKKMTEEEARFYFLQILMAIKYLHENLVVYRDLKPQNILIDHEGNLKIVDFGLSKKLDTNRTKTYSFCGSAQYMAPQMILRIGHSFSVDHYSLGALLYELVTGLPPFYSKDATNLKQSIVYEQLGFPSAIPLTEQIRDLLSRLLHKDHRIRLGSYAGIKQIICHPWIRKIKADQILSKKMISPFPTDLEEYNFDINQLGDDEQEFSGAIFDDLDRSKSKKNNRAYYKPKKAGQSIDSKIILELIQQGYNTRQSRENKENNHSFNNLHSSKLQKVPNKIKNALRKTNKTLELLRNSKQKNSPILLTKKLQINEGGFSYHSPGRIKMQQKLMPYLTKNPSSSSSITNKHFMIKKIPKSNILKMRVIMNNVQQSPNKMI